jgi:hypothetical protein
MDQDALLSLITQKLAAGKLPNQRIPRVSGLPSKGETCDVCGRVIEPGHFVMRGAEREGARSLHFHVDCLYLWDSTRKA